MAHALRKIRKLLLWCLVLRGINGCHGLFCPLSSTDCNQPGNPCTIVRDEGCKLAVSDKQAEYYPGPVTSFDVITNYVNSKLKRISQSNVEMKWSLPRNGTHRYLSGFEVRVFDMKSSHPYCFIFNVTGSTWNFESARRPYTLNCTALDEGNYLVEVTSLPKAPFSRMKAAANIYVKHKWADNDQACSRHSCWVSDLVVRNEPCKHSLTVSFNMAPPSEKIESYQVSLLKPDSLIVESKQTVLHDEHKTRAVVTLEVPKSLHRAVIKLVPGGEACKYLNCTVTASSEFDIPDVDYDVDCTFNQRPPSVTSTTASSTSLSVWIIILGSILAAAAIVTAIVVFASSRSRCRTGTELHTVGSPSPPGGDQPAGDHNTAGGRPVHQTTSAYRQRPQIPNDVVTSPEIAAPDPYLRSALDTISMNSSMVGDLVCGINNNNSIFDPFPKTDM